MKKLLVLVLTLMTLQMFAEVILYDEPYITDLDNGNVMVSVSVMQNIEDIEYAFFYYRAVGKESFTMIQANQDGGTATDFNAELPLSAYCDTGLEFYFEAETKDKVKVSLPRFNPEQHPYPVGILCDKSSSELLILSPETEHDAEEDFVFSVSYFSVQDDIDLESMKILFDGKDYTSRSTITDNMMVLIVPSVKPGMHSCEMQVRLKDGTLLLTGKHLTKVFSDKKVFELPFQLNGDATFRSNIFSVTKDDNSNLSNKDNDASFNLNLYSRSSNAHQKGFWYDFRGNFYRDSKQNETTQRFNRIKFDMEIPFLRVIMGDYTPNYSSYNMNNSNIYGVHAELDYHFIKIMYSTGENRRAIKDDENLHSTFARDMHALRLELGTDRSKYTAFLWGLHFSQTRDDVNSLDDEHYLFYADSDTTQTAFPEDNLVLGSDFILSLPSQRSSMGAEVAISFYNSNITDGAFSSEEMEDRFDFNSVDILAFDFEIDPENYEDLIIINENLQPYKPGMSSVALKAFVNPYLLHNDISVEYEEIGSGFKSLSTSGLQNDISKLSISDKINIKNMVHLYGGYNKNQDNLSEQKATTTTFNRYFGQLVFQYHDVTSLNLNFDTSSNIGEDDETEVEQFNQKSVNMSVGANYFWKQLTFAPTRFNVTYSNSKNTDELDDVYEITLNNVNFTMLNKFATFPLTTKLYYGWSNSESIVLDETTDTGSNSIGIRSEYGFFDNKLVPYTDLKFVMLSGDEEQSFNYFNIGAKYKPWAKTKIATNLRLKNYTNDTIEDINYNEFNWNFYISQRF